MDILPLSKMLLERLEQKMMMKKGSKLTCQKPSAKALSLWHLRRLCEEFLSTSTSAHVHVGDLCVICALHDTFKALNMASTDSKSQPVAHTSLRIALSNLGIEF
ncbi:hypothetical protein L2E82_29561 [Cichorium intybus]|uniref:Uncharacterized protein n=1 Tax=Cichorium intybus TaxID=13427 RepID=A0ACB9CXW2_CICIN|nr:hypothetical protein L2E82_29561 [Cichorium intybus]